MEENSGVLEALRSAEAILLDFDGVILDTESRVTTRKEKSGLGWEEFLNKLDWKELLDESMPLDNSLEIIREAQEKLKTLKGIITKIHTLSEMLEKTKYMRKNGIVLPIYYTPPKVDKNEIFIPTKRTILIDDSIKNIRRWADSGGTGILFTETNPCGDNLEINSLNVLRKVFGGRYDRKF